MLFDLFASEVQQEGEWTVGKTKGEFVVAWREQVGNTYFCVADRYWTPRWRVSNPYREFLEVFAGSRSTGIWSAVSGNLQREDAWVHWNINNYSLTDEIIPLIAVILWKASEFAGLPRFEMTEYWDKHCKKGKIVI